MKWFRIDNPIHEKWDARHSAEKHVGVAKTRQITVVYKEVRCADMSKVSSISECGFLGILRKFNWMKNQYWCSFLYSLDILGVSMPRSL